MMEEECRNARTMCTYAFKMPQILIFSLLSSLRSRKYLHDEKNTCMYYVYCEPQPHCDLTANANKPKQMF
jgi:hypothetical protein